nr:hypothetical protein [uncultured Lichenicoccus sp.]
MVVLPGLLLPAVAQAAPGTCATVVLPAGLGTGGPSSVGSLNPLVSNSPYDMEIYDQVYRPLIWLDRHPNHDPALSLASAATTFDGGQTWRFTIKPWLWPDGVPVSSGDVVFTFDLIRRLEPNYVGYDTGLGVILVLPEHVYRGMGVAEMRMRQTDPELFRVSDGPFLVDGFAVGRHIVLVPNPLNGGTRPKLRRLVVDFLVGSNPLQALRIGAIDANDIPWHSSPQAGIRGPTASRSRMAADSVRGRAVVRRRRPLHRAAGDAAKPRRSRHRHRPARGRVQRLVRDAAGRRP